MKIPDADCGRRKRENAKGIDVNPNSQADVIHDLNTFSWPLPDDEFELVDCSRILAPPTDVVRTMEEIHRVGKRGAIVEIRTPHVSSLYSWQDPTHRYHCALDSFDYFAEETTHTRFYTDKRFLILEKRVELGNSLISSIPKRIARISVHKSGKRFAFVFPANNL